MGYSPATQRLIAELERLPGIGSKTAERLAFYILRCSESEIGGLVEAIQDVKENVRPCSVCFSLGEVDPCHICDDPGRDRKVVCVVEDQKDLLALERVGSFRGMYHVLMGSLSPLDGVEPDDLTIDRLLERVKKDGITEVILATNPTAEGDCTSLYLVEQLAPMGARVTRLARGIPSGSSLEFTSAAILSDALEGRTPMTPTPPATTPGAASDS